MVPVTQVFKDTEVSKRQFDQVILGGGSTTHIPRTSNVFQVLCQKKFIR